MYVHRLRTAGRLRWVSHLRLLQQDCLLTISRRPLHSLPKSLHQTPPTNGLQIISRGCSAVSRCACYFALHTFIAFYCTLYILLVMLFYSAMIVC